MSNNACNCCEQPPCAAPTLEFVSVSARCSSEPCGENDPKQSPKPDPIAVPPVLAKYCTKITTDHGGNGTTVKTYSLDDDDNCNATCSGSWDVGVFKHAASATDPGDPATCAPPGTSGCTSFSTTGKNTYSADCSITYDATPSYGSHHYNTAEATNGIPGCMDNYSTSSITDCVNGVTTTTLTLGDGEPIITHGRYDGGPCSLCNGPQVDDPDVITYGDCVDVPACSLDDPGFPDYPEWESTATNTVALEEGQGYDKEAVRKWGPGGVTKEETKCKWRMRHSPTGTCYLKAWFRKTTTVTGDPDADPPTEDAVTVDDDSTPPYEWTGASEGDTKFCIKTPNDGVTAKSNDIIEETAHEIDVPDEDGSVKIEVLKYSCLKDYEPDVTDEENPQPNGYPDPMWEAAAP